VATVGLGSGVIAINLGVLADPPSPTVPPPPPEVTPPAQAPAARIIYIELPEDAFPAVSGEPVTELVASLSPTASATAGDVVIRPVPAEGSAQPVEAGA